MSSAAQITANRANAQFSTGPVTDAGKEATKYNATRHGLTSKRVLMPGEDPAEYEALKQSIIAEYDPQSDTEMFWTNEIAVSMWRLERAHTYEAKVLENAEAIFADPKSPHAKGFDRLMRYMGSIQRELAKAVKELRLLQKTRIANDTLMATRLAILAHAGSVSRYGDDDPLKGIRPGDKYAARVAAEAAATQKSSRR